MADNDLIVLEDAKDAAFVLDGGAGRVSAEDIALADQAVAHVEVERSGLQSQPCSHSQSSVVVSPEAAGKSSAKISSSRSLPSWLQPASSQSPQIAPSVPMAISGQ